MEKYQESVLKNLRHNKVPVFVWPKWMQEYFGVKVLQPTEAEISEERGVFDKCDIPRDYWPSVITDTKVDEIKKKKEKN